MSALVVVAQFNQHCPSELSATAGCFIHGVTHGGTYFDLIKEPVQGLVR